MFHLGCANQRCSSKAQRGVNYLGADSPPVFMYYNIPMKPFPPSNLNEGIHNPRFGLYLKDRMDKAEFDKEFARQ